jgi:hypothetical protein
VYAQDLHKCNDFYQKKNEEKTNYYIINYKEAQKQQLKIINKINDDYCIVYTDFEKINKQKNIPLNNKWKLQQIKNCKTEKYYSVFSLNIEKTTNQLLRDKKTFKHKTKDCIQIKCTYKYLTQLIASEEIYTVLEESHHIKTESKIRDQNFTINNINKILKQHPTLKGNTTKIGLKDENIDPSDIDLLNKINFTNQGENSTLHGTDMATIICGIGNSGIQGKGVAEKASIQFSNTSDLYAENINPVDFQTQNHSYGTVIEEFYGSLAQSFDDKIFQSQFNSHIFSVGNEGNKGYKTVTGNFKQAKNIITIGAVDQNETITPFSSKGPAYDGRIKPELVAYSETGTSNATALVSGISALLQEYYKTKNNELLKNATLKAILINSAKDLGNKGPDYTYGYGNVDAYASLQTIIKNSIIESNIINNELKTFQITIPQNSKKAKFTLVWDDLPAIPGSTQALINNLKITIKDTNNNDYFPYILDANNPEKEASTGLENINNIKQIEITNPIAGNYTIEVLGKEITSNQQNFSLAYAIETKDTFEWNYPSEGDNFPYNGTIISPFRWNSSIENQVGSLFISFDNGINWNLINNAIDIKKGQFKYIPTNKNCSIAKLKMTINNIDYISPSFIISYDLNLNTTLACNNTTEITWDNANSTNGYKIYELRDNEMKFKETVDQNYYSYSGYNTHTVSPIIDAFEGIKSESTLQTAPDTKCYFELVRSEVSDKDIEITTSLFSIYNIASIEIFKLENNNITLLNKIETNLNKLFTIKDLAPTIGENYYQVKIILKDGKFYESDIVSSFYVGKANYLLYPTIIKTEPITIITKDEISLPISIAIYNTSGKIVKNKLINSLSDTLELNELQKGIYLYKIQSHSEEKQTSVTGKLLKL